MIRNLKDTTRKNTEQDWLKTNLARFTRMLQGQRDLVTVSQLILSELAPLVNAQQARVLRRRPPQRRLAARAARRLRAAPAQEPAAQDRASAKGWSGSARSRRSASCSTDAPADYVRISSALGSARAAEHRDPAGAVRRPGEGGDRARLVLAASARPT